MIPINDIPGYQPVKRRLDNAIDDAIDGLASLFESDKRGRKEPVPSWIVYVARWAAPTSHRPTLAHGVLLRRGQEIRGAVLPIGETVAHPVSGHARIDARTALGVPFEIRSPIGIDGGGHIHPQHDLQGWTTLPGQPGRVMLAAQRRVQVPLSAIQDPVAFLQEIALGAAGGALPTIRPPDQSLVPGPGASPDAPVWGEPGGAWQWVKDRAPTAGKIGAAVAAIGGAAWYLLS